MTYCPWQFMVSLPFHCRNGCLPTIHSMAMVVLKSVTLFMLCYHIFLGNLSLSHNSSFKCFFFRPIFRIVLSPSSFRSLPVVLCVIGSDRDWCLSTAVVHCSTGDLWSPCPTSTTVSSSIFRRKIGLSENWLNHGKGSGTSPRPNSVSGGPAVPTV